MAIASQGTVTTSHSAITGTATSAAIDCRSWDSLYVECTLSTTGQWTVSLTGAPTSAGTYTDIVGQSMTFTATGSHVFHGVPDWVKVVATEDSGSAACTVKTMPLTMGGASISGEINLDTTGHLQVDVVSGAVTEASAASSLTALQLIDNAVYVDDADWTGDTSSHFLVGGVYQSVPQSITDGDVGPLEVDSTGNLRVIAQPSVLAAETVVAGAASVLGKIGTLAATTGVIYAACNASAANYSRVDWRVKSDNGHTLQFYRARTNVISGTITFADATAVDAGDTCIINGLTFTAHADTTTYSTRNFSIGADNAAAAANLVLCINEATYGVPGVTAVVAAVDATDVITITATTATALHFEQGTSAANEIAFADTTLASLIQHGAAITSCAANSTTSGKFYEQYVDGWPWLFCGLTNTDGDAGTVVVGATLYK